MIPPHTPNFSLLYMLLDLIPSFLDQCAWLLLLLDLSSPQPTILQSSIWYTWPLHCLLSWLLHKYLLGFPFYLINSFSVYVNSFFPSGSLYIGVPQHSVLGWSFPASLRVKPKVRILTYKILHDLHSPLSFWPSSPTSILFTLMIFEILITTYCLHFLSSHFVLNSL